MNPADEKREGEVDPKPLVFKDIGCVATMPPDRDSSSSDGGLGLLRDAAVVVAEAKVQWVGKGKDLPSRWDGASSVSVGGRVMMPGMVDCHTHIVYGGDRLGDFCRRCSGESYAEILQAGGGIHTTVQGTRNADFDSLITTARQRLHRMRAYGTTTVEIKSGYGLELESETKILKVIRHLGRTEAQNILSTFLGAHIVPREAASMEDYSSMVIEEMLPKVKKESLADFVDVFCEREAFDLASTGRILEAAKDLGFGLKVHAEQLNHSGGAQVAARVGAVSADHLDWANEDDLRALAKSGTVGVLLPSVALFTGASRYPKAEDFRNAGVVMALATDCNPGSSPAEDLSLVASLGCVQLGMTPQESLRAITVEAARALGLLGVVGSLLPGSRADMVLLGTDVIEPNEIPYRLGVSQVDAVILGGAFWSHGAMGSSDIGEMLKDSPLMMPEQ